MIKKHVSYKKLYTVFIHAPANHQCTCKLFVLSSYKLREISKYSLVTYIINFHSTFNSFDDHELWIIEQNTIAILKLTPEWY